LIFKALQRTFRLEFHLRATKVHVGWKFDGEIETAECIRRHRTFRHFIVLSILQDIVDSLNRTVEWANISASAFADTADPTLYVHFFARAIESAIVKDIPT